MPRYNVRVPMRSVQDFSVEASSPRAAKRKANEWLKGLRDEGDDMFVGDPGMDDNHPLDVRYWIVTEETRIASRQGSSPGPSRPAQADGVGAP